MHACGDLECALCATRAYIPSGVTSCTRSRAFVYGVIARTVLLESRSILLIKIVWYQVLFVRLLLISTRYLVIIRAHGRSLGMFCY